MSERIMSLIDSVRMVSAPPHPAGRPFIYAGLVATAVGGLIGGAWLFWFFALLTGFVVFFFRDPERVAPGRPGVMLAPADGRVVSVGPAVPPEELGLGPAPRWRVATFLSVFDVHVNRSPCEGTVTRIVYRHGAFLNAADKDADSNERNSMAIRLPDGSDVAVVQIAGLIARRIVCHAREGQALAAGERYGLIRFGSRTDLYLPVGVRPLVAEGQLMTGGETVIAELAPGVDRRAAMTDHQAGAALAAGTGMVGIG